MDIDDKRHYAKKAVIMVEQQEKSNVTGRSENVWHRSVTWLRWLVFQWGTVSRYLNGQQLKEKNMEKYQKRFQRWTIKNIIAKGLKNNRSFSIGLLINGISNRFGSEVVSGIERVAEENGYSLLLSGFADQPEKSNKNRIPDEACDRWIDRLLIRRRVVGFEMLTK